MKKKLYIKAALSLMSIALLSSCLKDSRYAVDFTKTTPLVELPGAANVSGSAGYFEVVGLVASDAPSPFNVPVNLASPHTFGNAITVTLKANPDSLNSYNHANSTDYTLLPAADYNASSLSVVIPAGQNLANLVVKVNTSALDPSLTYVLPLTIASVSQSGIQISNYNTILYELTVKNAYDDLYTETGYKFHTTPTASHPFTGNTVAVSTVNATTSQTAVGDLGGSGYVFNFDVDGTNLTNWTIPSGAATPLPPASGFMTHDYATPGGAVFTTDGAPGAGTQPGTAPYVSSTYNNTYDAGSKTFFMHYGYGVGTTDQSAYSRVFYIKLVGQ